MNTKVKLIFLVALISISTGCTSVSVHLPYGRLETPETNGQWRVQLKTGVMSVNDLEFTDDAADRPEPDMDHPKITNSYEAFFKGGIGMTEFLDLSIKGGASLILDAFSPTVLQVKLQPFGENQRDAAQGNFSAAVTWGAGRAQGSASGDQQSTFGEGGYDWSAKTEVTLFDSALIFGFRPSDNLVIYGGPYFTRYWSNIVINQDEVDKSGTEDDYDEGEYDASYVANLIGANVGLSIEFQKSIALMLETTYYQIHWPDHRIPFKEQLGAAIGVSFQFPN